MADDLSEQWRDWRAQRPPTSGIHLDAAAAGRMSFASAQAISAHLSLEAEVGAYVAQARAEDAVAAARADLAGLFGIPADGVAFVESATSALQALLSAWPLPADATVAVARSEWGQNLAAFESRGFAVVDLASDDDGVIDIEMLSDQLRKTPPNLVHITQVAAHRSLVQPLASITALCRDAGVPVWVDAAQALGHVDTTSSADAVYAPTRKWLCGSRGVAALAISAEHWPVLRVRHGVLAPSDETTVQALESDDAHVAGRVALATALAELREIGIDVISRRLAEVGAETRSALAELAGWEVLDGTGGAITALRPTSGQDVAVVRAQLLDEYRILTTASSVARAPREMTVPLLRLSPHVDCSPDQLAELRAALSTMR